MEFVETILCEGNNFCVKGKRVVVDNSFAHAFGVERGHYFEVEDLEVFEAFDECGEDVNFDNSDEDLINKLTTILEDKFNE